MQREAEMPVGVKAEAVVRRRRGLPVIWLVPVVALAVAAWLAVTTLREHGPTIELNLHTAEGLEAGKTQLRYKDVQIGLVDQVELASDHESVLAIIKTQRQAEPLIREGTRFWVVRPRIGLGGVSGLGTLLSGAYIEIDPGTGGKERRFTALEEPPAITSDAPGRSFRLKSADLGSLARGVPVSYEGLMVGQVLHVGLNDDRRTFDVDIFVNAPHDTLVRDTSRFWNASGIDVQIGTQGVEVTTESLQSIILGGVAFDTPGIEEPGEAAAAGREFPLYASRRRVDEPILTNRIPYLVYFTGSVRGLQIGNPVEFNGLRVGTVTDVKLELDPKSSQLLIPVTIEIEPQRLGISDAGEHAPRYSIVAKLVERGLRAQLKSGNLLTGELLVDLAFHPEAPPAELDMKTGSYPAIPSIPAELEQITRSVNDVLDQVAKARIGDLVAGLQKTVDGISALVNSPETKSILVDLKSSLGELRGVTATVGNDVGPLVAALRKVADASTETMKTADTTLGSVNTILGSNSKLRYDLNSALADLATAARSIRAFADYLDRHPDALLRGRGGQ